MFDILENWSLRRGGHLQEAVVTRGLTVLLKIIKEKTVFNKGNISRSQNKFESGHIYAGVQTILTKLKSNVIF